jgi:hypothetical protein
LVGVYWNNYSLTKRNTYSSKKMRGITIHNRIDYIF